MSQEKANDANRMTQGDDIRDAFVAGWLAAIEAVEYQSAERVRVARALPDAEVRQLAEQWMGDRTRERRMAPVLALPPQVTDEEPVRRRSGEGFYETSPQASTPQVTDEMVRRGAVVLEHQLQWYMAYGLGQSAAEDVVRVVVAALGLREER